MPRMSKKIAKLSAQLSRVQSDKFQESILVPAIINHCSPLVELRGGMGKKMGKIGRFFSRISFGLGECWYWRGRLDPDGYGTFGMQRAHRESYVLFCGEIPEGCVVMHKCDVRNCVNPEHLSIGTHQDNIKDRDNKGRTHRGPRANGKRARI